MVLPGASPRPGDRSPLAGIALLAPTVSRGRHPELVG